MPTTPLMPTPIGLSDVFAFGTTSNFRNTALVNSTIHEVETLQKKVEELTEQNIYLCGQLDGIRDIADLTSDEHIVYTAKDKAWFPHINLWLRIDYKDGMNVNNAITVKEVDDNGGNKDIRANKQQHFLEDENGKVISSAQVREIRQFTYDLFTDLKTKGRNLVKWHTGAGAEVKRWLYIRITKRFPLVSLCESNWKVEYLAVQLYPQWKKKQSKKEKGKKEQLDMEGNEEKKRKRGKKVKVEVEVQEGAGGMVVVDVDEQAVGHKAVETSSDLEEVPTKKQRISHSVPPHMCNPVLNSLSPQTYLATMPYPPLLVQTPSKVILIPS
ncbi:hypothetical protein PQX77_018653 [Marasmius sp. AFHP31]|nr:hypothetical protein PQX77_018653 [Marasmius sp. AFHP31]